MADNINIPNITFSEEVSYVLRTAEHCDEMTFTFYTMGGRRLGTFKGVSDISGNCNFTAEHTGAVVEDATETPSGEIILDNQELIMLPTPTPFATFVVVNNKIDEEYSVTMTLGSLSFTFTNSHNGYYPAWVYLTLPDDTTVGRWVL
jgi:hypothetical protein